MASQKVTKMVVDVDLNCSDCYKKIKKVIGKIPEIRDQEYDVEKKQVKISVISCCPHKIRDKLRHKGGSSIQKIEIVEKAKSSDKPKDAPKAKAADKDSAKPKEAAEKPKAKGGEVSKMVFEPVHGYPQIIYPPSYPIPMPMVGYEGYSGGALHGYGMAPQPSGYGSYDYDYHHHHRNNRGNYYLTQENPQECPIM